MLELLIGPIASGKSSYCKMAANEGAIILNDDALVSAIHSGDYTLYKKELKPLYKAAENAIVQTGLIMGCRVVIDRPNISMQMRKRYIGLAKSLDKPVKLILFDFKSPAVHAKRRMKSDGRGYDFQYWLDVAKYHKSLYEAPNKDVEHFDELIKWSFPKGYFAK